MTNGTAGTSYSSAMSGCSSASTDIKEIEGGDVVAYVLARASRAADICWHGAAHGAWKYRTDRAVEGSEDCAFWKSSLEVIIVTLTGSLELLFSVAILEGFDSFYC